MLYKHDSNVVLEIVGAMGIIAAFAIAGMLFLIHQDIKNGDSEKAPVVAESSKKISATDLSPELVKELNGNFGTLNQNLDQMAFLLGKNLEKNYTQDEIKALIAEYAKAKEAAQKDAEQKAAAGQQAPADQAPAATQKK
ncbi:MAG: hypothetical protein WCJ84_00675 [Candidatus Peregrinibacteria bacterium]